MTDKKTYPVLKMPNPKFNILLLEDDKVTGLLSRVERKERVGVEQIIVNELNKEGDIPFAYGIIKMGGGKRFEGIGTLPKNFSDGLDEFTLREFQSVHSFWFHPFELVKAFKPPLHLKTVVPGRRYASEINIDEDTKKKTDQSESDIPDDIKRFVIVDDSGIVKRIPEDEEIIKSDDSPMFALAVQGLARPWMAFPLSSDNENIAVREASEILVERRKALGILARHLGRTAAGLPAYEAKLKLQARVTKVSDIEEILSVSPQMLKDLGDDVLKKFYAIIHSFYVLHFGDNSATSIGTISREDIVNAYIFILEEMGRRGSLPKPVDQLDSEVRDLVPDIFKVKQEDVDIDPEFLAPINASGEKAGRKIEISEILTKIKSFRFRQDAIVLVGGLVNHGSTDNDIDILLKGPMDEGIKHVLKFRLGRMLGPELSQRVQFLEDDELGGPFTNHIPLGNLAFEVNTEFALKEMRDLEKQGDPLLDTPKKGKRPAVFQLHFRGRSVHGDFRILIDDYLIGWTLSLQKEGAIKEPVLSVTEGKHIAAGYDVAEGNPYLKPFLAPDGIYAEPKSARQPRAWLDVADETSDPGSVGATRNFPAVFVLMEHPKVEFGRQSPHFHEYFVSGSKYMNGVVMFRQLVSQGEQEGGTRAGEAFWKMFLSKNYLPSVLNRRTVEKGDMPPDGISWLPELLERDVPQEYRYWEKKGADAKKIRDALVDARIFTEDSVGLVNGEIRLIKKKFFTEKDGHMEEVVLDKDLRTVDYTLSRQSFRGPIQIRTGYSKVFWWLVLDQPGKSGVLAWKLQIDPLSGDNKISAIKPMASQVNDKELLAISGDLKPGSRYNDTKDTPSRIDIVGKGKVDLLDEQSDFLKIRFKSGPLKGAKVLQAEESGSKIWEYRDSTLPGKSIGEGTTKKSSIRTENGVQIWNIEDKDDNVDRRELSPLAIYTPMKPAEGFFDPGKLIDEWAKPRILSEGLAIEPKYNGLRTSIQANNGKVLIFFEDTKSDRSKILPSITAEALRIEKEIGPFIIDAEIQDYNDDGSAKPRRTFSRFTGPVQVQDDSHVKMAVFQGLYLHGKNLTAVPYHDMRPLLEKMIKEHGGKHFFIAPYEKVYTREDFVRALKWAGEFPGSEGAMVKMLESTYSLGGETDSWTKLKTVRNVKAIVAEKFLKQPSPHQESPAQTWVYLCAVGPISEKDIDSIGDLIKIKGQWYSEIGKTFATNVKASQGDVIEVQFTELLVDRSGEKKTVHWFTPVVIEKVEHKPDTFTSVEGRAFEHEIKKFVDKVLEKQLPIIVKKDDGKDEQIVYGVVLEPETVDKQNDIYSEDEVRQAAHLFMEEYRHLGLMHKIRLDGRLKILETYLAPQELVINGVSVKKGTWLMVIRVLDKVLWKAVKDKRLTGLSIAGSAQKESDTVEVQ